MCREMPRSRFPESLGGAGQFRNDGPPPLDGDPGVTEFPCLRGEAWRSGANPMRWPRPRRAAPDTSLAATRAGFTILDIELSFL